MEDLALKVVNMSVDSGTGSLEQTVSPPNLSPIITPPKAEPKEEKPKKKKPTSVEIPEVDAELETIGERTLRRMHSEMSRLTSAEREFCKKSYKKIDKHAGRFGMAIMLRLFSDYPNYKNIWPLFREIPDSSLINAPALMKHANVYMGGIRTIIAAMDDDVKLERSLRRIAHAHVKWSIHKRHLMHMLPCLLTAFEEYCPMDAEAKTAWTTLFDVIANLIDIFRTQL